MSEQDHTCDIKEFSTYKILVWVNPVAHVVILFTEGLFTKMLCNPKFISKNNQYFDLSSRYFLYPLASLPKMVKQEMPASIKQG